MTAPGRADPHALPSSTALRMSGSRLSMFRRAARLAGDASCPVMSTNSCPPASCIGRAASICQTDKPSGFIASIIICW